MAALLPLLRPFRGALLLAGLLVSAAAALELLPHLIVYLAAEAVLATPARTDALLGLAVLGVVGVTARFLLLGAGLIVSHKLTFRALSDLRRRLVERITNAPASARAAHSPGDLKKTLVEDVDGLEGLVSHNLPDLASAVIVPTSAFFALLLVDWRLALVSVGLAPVAFGVMGVIMSRFDGQFAQWQAAESRANARILEFLRGIAVLKAHDRDASSLSRLRSAVDDIRDLAQAMTRRSVLGYEAFLTLIASNLVVVLPAGLLLHRAGTLDAPTLVLFVVLGFGLTAPLVKLMFVFGQVQMHAERLRRISAVLAMEAEPLGTAAPPADGGDVTAAGVTFAYDAQRGPVLHDVHLSAPAGQLTALVGPSGSGKTTLMALLAGARRPDAGRVTVGGVEVAALSADGRDAVMTWVTQHAWLFRGTLLDNVRLGAPEAPLQAVNAAAERAGLGPVLAGLPAGWQAEVGERGATLSGGEAQRVAIARALVRDRPVLLLDEVTAHLDPSSERAVQRALSELVNGRTVIVVAHRLRTIRHADHIVCLDGGRVVGAGTHAELLAGCPTYARLWRAQERARTWRLGPQAPAQVEVPA